MNVIKEEPVAVWGSLTAVFSAIVGMLTTFNVINWTTEQMGAVMLVTAAVGGLLVVLVRGKVEVHVPE